VAGRPVEQDQQQRRVRVAERSVGAGLGVDEASGEGVGGVEGQHGQAPVVIVE
jgi:hypothetical protein